MRSKFFAFFLFITLITNVLNAYDDTFLDLTSGYRYDQITAHATYFNAAGGFVSSDQITLNHFGTWHIGGNGKYMLNGWTLRGTASFGCLWGAGRYNENVQTVATFTPIIASIRRGTTYDFSAGFGRMFPIGCGFEIGPLIGWSYDFQRAGLTHASANDVALPAIGGVRYINRWMGPWVGFDVTFNNWDILDRYLRDLVVTVGYEFHWADWNGKWKLKGADVFNGPFSDQRTSHHTFGNVIHGAVRWNFCDNWNVGLCLKLQDWRAKKGSVSPLRAASFPAINSVITSGTIDRATWKSAYLGFEIGFNF